METFWCLLTQENGCDTSVIVNHVVRVIRVIKVGRVYSQLGYLLCTPLAVCIDSSLI